MSEHRYASGEEPMIRDIVERVDERGGHSHIKPNELLVVTSIEAPVEGLSSERLINHALYPCRFRLIARSAKPEHFSAAEPSPYNGANAVSSDTNPTVDWSSDHPKQNTDREIWHDRDDHGYGPSIFVTQGGAIGINVGGTVKVRDVRDWHGCDSEVEYLLAKVERLTKERDSWIETARQHLDNEFFYKGLLTQIGDMFGIEAKTSDDGSVQDSVLALKVPELVERLTKESASQKSELKMLGEAVKRLNGIRDELTKERDAIAKQLECEKANSEHRWELSKKYAKCVGKIREGLGDDAKRFQSCELPAFAESLRKERDELRAKLDESEAAAAKMREALESALPETRETRGVESWVVTFDDGRDWHCGAEPFMRLCDVFYSATAGREFLAERDKMREEIESLKSQLAETEEDRAATHAKLSQVTGRLECCRRNYELCDKDLEKALNQLAKLGEEINGPNGWKATCEVQRQTIAGYENGLTTPLSVPERSAYESRANEYRAELQRQLNEAWMRIDYTTADRIADLLGVPKPSDHEKEDLKPADEWPEVYETEDGRTITFASEGDTPQSQFRHGPGCRWQHSEAKTLVRLGHWKLVSKGGKPVEEVK